MDIILRQKLSLLINLARADGHFAGEEKAVIRSLGMSHGMTKNEIEELMDSPDSLQSLGALSKARKKEYLIDSIGLMLADGQILEQEKNFCKNLANKLFYHNNVVDYLLDNWSADVSTLDLRDYQLSNF